MSIDSKNKIALITYDDGKYIPPGETLEAALARKGYEVEVFNLCPNKDRTPEKQAPDGKTAEQQYQDGAKDHRLVIRNILGKPGITKQSEALQARIEANGAKADVSVETLENVTDKIRCRSILKDNEVPLCDMVEAPLGTLPDRDAIAKFAEGSIIVRKNLGSGPTAVKIVANADEAVAAVEAFAKDKPPSASIIHARPPFHYRAAVVRKAGKNEIVGVWKVTYPDGKFGLNPLQGATLTAIDPADLGETREKLEALAKQANGFLGLETSAIDIALDKNNEPYILDMNPSPDLSLKTHKGRTLQQEVVERIAEKMQFLSRGDIAREGA